MKKFVRITSKNKQGKSAGEWHQKEFEPMLKEVKKNMERLHSETKYTLEWK